jgi:hypothetical protein
VTASLQFILAGVVIFILTAKILEKGIKVPPWVSIEYLLYLPPFTVPRKHVSMSPHLTGKLIRPIPTAASLCINGREDGHV